MPIARLRFWGAAFGLACICILAGCESVSITTNSTATPPTITWNVTDRSTNALTQYPANQNLSVKVGGSYYVSMHATSPSGVKSLTVQPDESWTCNGTGSEPIAQNMDAYIAPDNESQKATGGTASDTLFSFIAIDIGMTCNSGFAFAKGTFSFDGSATNFAGMQTKGTFTFSVTP